MGRGQPGDIARHGCAVLADQQVEHATVAGTALPAVRRRTSTPVAEINPRLPTPTRAHRDRSVPSSGSACAHAGPFVSCGITHSAPATAAVTAAAPQHCRHIPASPAPGDGPACRACLTPFCAAVHISDLARQAGPTFDLDWRGSHAYSAGIPAKPMQLPRNRAIRFRGAVSEEATMTAVESLRRENDFTAARRRRPVGHHWCYVPARFPKERGPARASRRCRSRNPRVPETCGRQSRGANGDSGLPTSCSHRMPTCSTSAATLTCSVVSSANAIASTCWPTRQCVEGVRLSRPPQPTRIDRPGSATPSAAVSRRRCRARPSSPRKASVRGSRKCCSICFRHGAYCSSASGKPEVPRLCSMAPSTQRELHRLVDVLVPKGSGV